MEDNKKIIVKGVDAANCNFEASEVEENGIELLKPENYPVELRASIDEIIGFFKKICHRSQPFML